MTAAVPEQPGQYRSRHGGAMELTPSGHWYALGYNGPMPRHLVIAAAPFQRLFDESEVAERERIASRNAWASAYLTGIDDERTSESNIGIAGLGGKIGPARRNPYDIT